MKRILQMGAFALLIVLGSSFRNDASAQYEDDYYEDEYYEDESYDNRGEVSYENFYDELSPHGNWVEYPGHGYVWQPRLGIEFRPYSTGGHWVWNNRHGWIWVSDYDWGWAPFHYGRWFHDPYYGWLWVPGYEWSGAWVTWRHGGDYYGWAPIRPGITISINFNIGSYAPPVDWWIFAPRRHVFSRNIYNYCVDYRRNVNIIHNTTIINNYYYGDRYGFRSGPRRTEFERYTGRITPVNFRQSDRPGRSTFRNNEVSIYRPNVRQDNNRVAPRKFERYNGEASNNGNIRNNDVRGNGNNDFRRNNGNTEISPRTNDLPRERSRFERRTADPRDQNNGTIRNNPGNRRFERNTQSQGNQEVRPQRQQRTTSPGNENGNGRFERRPAQNNNAPVRQPEVRSMDRRQQSPQFERREQRSQPQVERRQTQPQVERRQSQPQVERRQSQPQFERRQSQVQQQQPRQIQQRESPSRQSERRDNGSNNGNENGNRGNGKRRF
jgi:hypothetical protein